MSEFSYPPCVQVLYQGLDACSEKLRSANSDDPTVRWMRESFVPEIEDHGFLADPFPSYRDLLLARFACLEGAATGSFEFADAALDARMADARLERALSKLESVTRMPLSEVLPFRDRATMLCLLLDYAIEKRQYVPHLSRVLDCPELDENEAEAEIKSIACRYGVASRWLTAKKDIDRLKELRLELSLVGARGDLQSD